MSKHIAYQICYDDGAPTDIDESTLLSWALAWQLFCAMHGADPSTGPATLDQALRAEYANVRELAF